ncbi:MAG: superoxide dismutase [Elusimicrobiota bacterium]|nr:MAG: superoxide dismutase [Elusimicrobiota bacterium]
MTSIAKARSEIRPWSLEGISEDQIAQHWALYEGYVKNEKALSEKLALLSKVENFGSEFAELKRRWSFEANGVILHELYFEALKKGGGQPGEAAGLTKLLKKHFGGFAAWRKEFEAAGKMRGVGWVILYWNPREETLANVWISSHEDGHPAGCVPLLVMDVWEHAYMVDWGASGRADYIGAFFRNVDWGTVEERWRKSS